MKNDDEDDEEFGFQYIYMLLELYKSQRLLFSKTLVVPRYRLCAIFYERHVIDARYNKIENRIEFIHV